MDTLEGHHHQSISSMPLPDRPPLYYSRGPKMGSIPTHFDHFQLQLPPVGNKMEFSPPNDPQAVFNSASTGPVTPQMSPPYAFAPSSAVSHQLPSSSAPLLRGQPLNYPFHDQQQQQQQQYLPNLYRDPRIMTAPQLLDPLILMPIGHLSGSNGTIVPEFATPEHLSDLAFTQITPATSQQFHGNGNRSFSVSQSVISESPSFYPVPPGPVSLAPQTQMGLSQSPVGPLQMSAHLPSQARAQDQGQAQHLAPYADPSALQLPFGDLPNHNIPQLQSQATFAHMQSSVGVPQPQVSSHDALLSLEQVLGNDPFENDSSLTEDEDPFVSFIDETGGESFAFDTTIDSQIESHSLVLNNRVMVEPKHQFLTNSMTLSSSSKLKTKPKIRKAASVMGLGIVNGMSGTGSEYIMTQSKPRSPNKTPKLNPSSGVKKQLKKLKSFLNSISAAGLLKSPLLNVGLHSSFISQEPTFSFDECSIDFSLQPPISIIVEQNPQIQKPKMRGKLLPKTVVKSSRTKAKDMDSGLVTFQLLMGK